MFPYSLAGLGGADHPEDLIQRQKLRPHLVRSAERTAAGAGRLLKDYDARLSQFTRATRAPWNNNSFRRSMRALLNAGPGASGAVLLWCPLVLLGVAVGIGLGATADHRLGRALAERRCPDCRYDLGGLKCPLAAIDRRAAILGPERCPECGGRWPLLPPPVLRKGRSARPGCADAKGRSIDGDRV